MKYEMENRILPDENYNSLLARYPIVSIFLVAGLFLLCTTWKVIFHGVTATMFVFISLAVVGLFGMPFILGLPNGRKPLTEYMKDIRLKTESSLFQDITIGVISAGLLLTSLILSSVITVNFYFEVDKILAEQVIESLTHGIWEEVYFRGVILVLCIRVLRKQWLALVMAAAVFSAIHFDLDNFFRLSLIGFLWGYMTVKTNSLLPAIISHTLFNLISSAMVPEISGLEAYQWLVIWHLLIVIAVFVSIWVTNTITRWWSTKEDREVPAVL